VSIEFRYYIDIVESKGGTDFSFSHISDHELVPTEVVQDDLGRSYVVISAETTPDPLDDDIRLGTATVRPV